MRRLGLLSAMLFACLQGAQASGFMVSEMATRASGMASAFTAVADDASAAWYNPAGVAFTSGGQIMVGGDVIFTAHEFSTNASNPLPPAVANAKDGVFFVPHAYFTYRDENSRLGAALSINSPFGLESEWPTTSPFASKATFSRINMIMVNPSLVFQLTDRISIAGGGIYAHVNKIDLNSTIQHMSGDGNGWGGSASIFYKGDAFNLGVTYRSRIKFDLSGLATAVPGAPLAIFGATNSSAATGLTLPDQVNVGFAFMPNDQLTLSLDADWVNWKTLDTINITYGSAAYRGILAAISGSGSTAVPFNWKAVIAIRAGVEWKYSSSMRARAGYIYDPTPVKDVDFSPAIADNDRHIFSIGYGFNVTPEVTIDLAYTYVYIKTRNQTQSLATPLTAPNSVKNGTYKGDGHIAMASLNYHF